MPLVLKICGGSWENASRDKRELSVCKELGYEVAVLAKGEEKDYGRIESVDGYKVYRYTTRPFGEKCPSFINRVFSLLKWAHFAKKLKPEVISGHDLLPGLTIAWLTNVISKKKAQLIYDSHEFELGRNQKRGKLQRYFVSRWEKYLMKKCKFSIMVNDTIADEVQKIHKLDNRPVVVRSTPNLWTIDEQICNTTRNDLIAQFDLKD